jgi:hypothetical protein
LVDVFSQILSTLKLSKIKEYISKKSRVYASYEKSA